MEILIWTHYPSPLPNKHLLVPMTISVTPKPLNDVFKSPTISHDTSHDKSCDHNENRFTTICKPNDLFIPPTGSEVIKLHQLIGYAGSGCGTLQWNLSKGGCGLYLLLFIILVIPVINTGLLCYSSGCVIILQDMTVTMATQCFLIGHPTIITTLALQTNGCGLASASSCDQQWSTEIRIWDMNTCTCTQVGTLINIEVYI